MSFTVLVAVGTDHHPFRRLVEWADAYAAARPEVRVIVQHGTAPAPLHAEGHDYLRVEDLRAIVARADAVVCHGGPATIMEIREAGLLPIAVPRRPELGEHVDAHQVRFVARVLESGRVVSAESGDELASLLDRAVADPSVMRIDTDPSEVRASIARFADMIDAMLR